MNRSRLATESEPSPLHAAGSMSAGQPEAVHGCGSSNSVHTPVAVGPLP